MDCKYYKKCGFLKRVFGNKGYCTLHQVVIKQHTKMSYYPYICCKDANNELIKDCTIQLKFECKK